MNWRAGLVPALLAGLAFALWCNGLDVAAFVAAFLACGVAVLLVWEARGRDD
jgi:hypothetical protein